MDRNTESSKENKSLLSLEVLRKLPKAELHLHLDGSIRVSTIIELAKEQGVELPTYDEVELKKLVTVDLNCQSLEEYLRGFDITLRVLQRSYAITRALYEVCEDAVKDGVRYIEVRFSPILHVRGGLSLSGVMEAIVQGHVMAEYNLPIKVGIIVCGMRQLPSKVTQNLAEIAWRYRHKGIVGFDLAGPEEGFSSKHHKDAFVLVRSKCINCTLHSGEGAGWESVQDSIQFCGAHRLGHGVRLIENEALFKLVVDRGIAIECCPTSNVQTKAVKRLEDHPIRKFFDAGAIVVLSTDNRVVSGVTLSEEFQLIQKVFGFTIEEIVRMIDYGFKASFMEASTKRRIRAEVIRQCVTILKENGYDVSGIVANHEYYDYIGVDLNEVLSPEKRPYWRSHVNPDITEEIVRALPKTDLHCNLDGSVSIPWIWAQLQKEKIDLKALFDITCNTQEDLVKILQPKSHTTESTLLCKRLIKQVLQTVEQLESALEDIYEHAIEDGVKYMEIAFRPQTHTLGGLTTTTALTTVLNKTKQLNEKYKGIIKGAIVVYVSTVADDPIAFRETAELAVKFRASPSFPHGVCGFGIYGDSEITEKTKKYFMSTLNYLKTNFMNVAISCGKQKLGSIITALDAGAHRISGAFEMHKFPRLMSYIANHCIPVELSLTEKLLSRTEDIGKYLHPIRLFIDNDVPVTICSFRGTLSQLNRTSNMHQIVRQCGLSISHLIGLLANGFRYNFQPYDERLELYANFKRQALQYLTEKNFQYFTKKCYFPSK
jgi:adenosine deaminase